jgi:ABC-2 type transport system permease protein
MFINQRLLAVSHKELKEILRDRLYLALAFGVPLLLFILFGFGLTLDVNNIPFAVLDQNRSPQSRAFLDRLGRSRYFAFQGFVDRRQDLEAGLVSGRIRLGLVIPPDFDRTLRRGGPSDLQALIDGAFPDRAAAILSYLEIMQQEFTEELRAAAMLPQSSSPRLQVETRAWFNPDLQSRNFIVPGLLATNLFFYPALLASIAVVREKESGAIFNIYCAPIRTWEYLGGKLLPYWGIGVVNYFLLVALTRLVFAVPLRGSFLFLTLAACLYIGVTTSLGLLISVLLRTQVGAMLLTTVLTLIPAFIYSGFFIAVPSMALEAQIMAYILPVTYFLDIVRGVYLKNLGLQHYWPHLLILSGFLGAFLGLSLLKLKKRLD